MFVENLFSIKGKTALVTGGSRGIGEMIASGFCANGAKVYITARSKDTVFETAKIISNKYDISTSASLSAKRALSTGYTNSYFKLATVPLTLKENISNCSSLEFK